MAEKRKGAIFLFMIEMLLSSVVMMSLVGQMLSLHKSAQITNAFDGDNCYYFSPRTYYDPDFSIGDYLSEAEKKNLKTGSVHVFSAKTKEKQSVKIIGYSDFIIERARIKTDRGTWFTDKTCNVVPLIAVGSRYSVGQQITFSDGTKGEVIGAIAKDSYVVSFQASASSGNASLRDLISVPSAIDLIAPFQSEKFMSFPAHVISNELTEQSQIIAVENTQEQRHIVKTLNKYGDVSSIEQMIKNFDSENKNYFLINGIIFFVFTILTIVGIGGLNGIWSVENENVYTIMYMLGLHTKTCMLVEAINTFTVVGVSYLVFFLLSHWLAKSILPEGVHCGKGIWMAILVYFLLIYALTSVSSIVKAGKRNLMELYKREN